ncbi:MULTISPECIES: hypothetical protein [unclassified Stenotrophomonas]|uniref:hypothetical protein n=1 Tax=unclassified Stenotrophomonas TaxID=196198 RepID=UPI001312103B|nr:MULTISPECIES: hypothetical protein [unclassified Stenotrophomonas]
MAIALIALLLMELVLQMAWNRLYFVWGITLFDRRIAAPADARARLTPGSLERDLATGQGATLAFHRFPDGLVAFRGSFGFAQRRYYPLMRGLIMVDAERNQVRVLGLCSWFPVAFVLALVPIIALRPSAAPLLLLPVIFVIGYVIQKKQFLAVVEAIRAQLDDTPMDVIMAERLQARGRH